MKPYRNIGILYSLVFKLYVNISRRALSIKDSHSEKTVIRWKAKRNTTLKYVFYMIYFNDSFLSDCIINDFHWNISFAISYNSERDASKL